MVLPVTMSYKKRIVITGASGLIGGQLLKDLSDEYEILKLDLSTGHDLTNENFVEEWFKENNDLHGMIVCHAYNPLPLKETKKIEPIDQSIEELRSYYEVNVISAFNVCRHFIKNNKSGSIINISSLYGLNSPKHNIYNNFTKPIGYSLTKSSIIAMTKYLATYYAPDYRFNAVVLGGVYDERFDKSFIMNYNEHTPFKRMMNVEETTGIFKYLMSDSSSYTTGGVFVVDGGWTAW
jgi:NAD(P)-dependent dehydrogenase (short-subunit alcohol dehydrogenase family)